MTRAASTQKQHGGPLGFVASLPVKASNWFMPLHRRLVVSMLFSLALCAFFAACVEPGDYDDDYSISFFLSGRIPNMGLSLFLNAAWCRMLFVLNTLVPAVNWFFVLEYTCTFLALWAITYAALSYVRLEIGLAVLGFMTIYVVPYCIASSNYTVVSGICTGAGMLYLALYLYLHDSRPLVGIVGVLGLAFGVCWRYQMFEAALPFMGILVLWWAIEALVHRDSSSEASGSLRSRATRLWPLLLAALLCGSLYCYDHLAWQQDGWREWREYNSPRSRLVDFPMPEYGEIATELEGLGVSENDYVMLTSWAGGDTDTFPTETLQQVAALGTPFNADAAHIVDAVWDFIRTLGRNPIYHISIALIWLLQLLFIDRRRLTPAVLALLAACALCVYLILRQRFVIRVETPLWYYAIVSLLALGARTPCDQPVQHEAQAVRSAPLTQLACTVLSLGIFLVGCGAAVCHYAPSFDPGKLGQLFHQDDAIVSGPLTTYVTAHPDTYYVVAVLPHTWMEKEHDDRYLFDESTSLRVMPLAGWDTNAPFRLHQASLLGQTNVVATLLADNPAMFISDELTAQWMLTFLQEHYEPGTTCAMLDVITVDGSVCAWSFSSPQ